MRILLIHNKYNFVGGEDSMVDIERDILLDHNHTVKTLFFDNKDIDSVGKKLALTYKLLYNSDSKNTLEQAIREFKPDIIHGHNLFYVASPSILFAAHKNKVPLILTLHNYRLICSGALLMRESRPCELCTDKKFPIHGIRYGCFQHSKLKTAQLTFTTGIHKLIKTWNGKVAQYIASTEFARNKFISSSLKLRPEQIVVKPNSVPDIGVSDFDEREDYFLYIGRLSSEKGIEVLLKAFEKKSITIEIIGGGPLQHLAETSAANNENIKYWGYTEKAFMISKLKKCRALIVPSTCYESLPTTVLEAFSAGTPVIISNLGNLNEIVTHHHNGIHFKTNDAPDLYSAVEDFARNSNRYQPLYLNARKTYLEKYTPEINYKNLLRIYEKALETFRN